jgi:hypothetical protein
MKGILMASILIQYVGNTNPPTGTPSDDPDHPTSVNQTFYVKGTYDAKGATNLGLEVKLVPPSPGLPSVLHPLSVTSPWVVSFQNQSATPDGEVALLSARLLDGGTEIAASGPFYLKITS